MLVPLLQQQQCDSTMSLAQRPLVHCLLQQQRRHPQQHQQYGQQQQRIGAIASLSGTHHHPHLYQLHRPTALCPSSAAVNAAAASAPLALRGRAARGRSDRAATRVTRPRAATAAAALATASPETLSWLQSQLAAVELAGPQGFALSRDVTAGELVAQVPQQCVVTVADVENDDDLSVACEGRGGLRITPSTHCRTCDGGMVLLRCFLCRVAMLREVAVSHLWDWHVVVGLLYCRGIDRPHNVAAEAAQVAAAGYELQGRLGRAYGQLTPHYKVASALDQ